MWCQPATANMQPRPTPRIWDNPTMAMNDIERLSYRSPEAERILPAGLGQGEEDTTLRFPSLGIQQRVECPEAAWNMASIGRGRGRGALLRDRNMIHQNNLNLKRQLEIANGIGYSNDLIEARFQNVPLAVEPVVEETANAHFYDDDDLQILQVADKRKRSPETTSEEEGSAETAKVNVDDEDVDVSVNEDGEWNWQARTTAPDRDAFWKNKNVAMASIQRLRKRESTKAVEKDVILEVRHAPQVAAVPKVKEDWRAEIKAAEEANSSKSKKGWRSTTNEHLLGDLKVEKDWSMFAPSVASKSVEDFPSLGSYVTEGMNLAPVVNGGQPKSGGNLDVPQRAEKKGKSKKNRNVRQMWVPEERTRVEPTVAPPGYLIPTNGLPPMAMRNPEYNPLPSHNSHNTFGNLFGRAIQNLKKTSCSDKYKKNGEFSLSGDDFPQLK